jgi:hypothetical protein
MDIEDDQAKESENKRTEKVKQDKIEVQRKVANFEPLPHSK